MVQRRAPMKKTSNRKARLTGKYSFGVIFLSAQYKKSGLDQFASCFSTGVPPGRYYCCIRRSFSTRLIPRPFSDRREKLPCIIPLLFPQWIPQPQPLAPLIWGDIFLSDRFYSKVNVRSNFPLKPKVIRSTRFFFPLK